MVALSEIATQAHELLDIFTRLYAYRSRFASKSVGQFNNGLADICIALLVGATADE